MNALLKVRVQYLMGIIWGLYAVYLVLFRNLLLFPKDSLELIIPGLIQIVIFLLFIKLFKEKYAVAINLMSLICCGLVILWHFSFITNISQGLINGLFAIAPLLSIIAVYIMNRVEKKCEISILKQLCMIILVDFLNFVAGVFSFYIFHYWI